MMFSTSLERGLGQITQGDVEAELDRRSVYPAEEEYPPAPPGYTPPGPLITPAPRQPVYITEPGVPPAPVYEPLLPYRPYIPGVVPGVTEEPIPPPGAVPGAPPEEEAAPDRGRMIRIGLLVGGGLLALYAMRPEKASKRLAREEEGE